MLLVASEQNRDAGVLDHEKVVWGAIPGTVYKQLTSSMRQMQTLAPWQGSPEWSFQIFCIMWCTEARIGWMLVMSADDRQEYLNLLILPSLRRKVFAGRKANEVYCPRKFCV